MTDDMHYKSGKGVLGAMKEKAREAYGREGVPTVQDRLSLAIHDRFLCRVFAAESAFALKGGTSMLARIPKSRRTSDVDLETVDVTLDEAITELRQLVETDYGDHLHFTYVKHHSTGGGANQPELEAAQITFDVTAIGKGKVTSIKVDLAIHMRSNTAPLVELEPAFRLALPRPLPTRNYRVIAVEDQIADKACATMSLYGPDKEGSSRSKDLIDLAILAQTTAVDARQLRRSVTAETLLRRLDPFAAITVPQTMKDGYVRLARGVPILGEETSWEDHVALVNGLLKPALTGEVAEGTWDPQVRAWIPF